MLVHSAHITPVLLLVNSMHSPPTLLLMHSVYISPTILLVHSKLIPPVLLLGALLARELAWRLHNIKMFWPGSINKVAVLLTLPVDKIKKISSLAAQESNIIPQKTRINYLSDMLQCSISDICDLSSRYFFIHTVPFARLSSILKILLDAGVTPEDILKDVWVFRYNPQFIQSRLDRIKESGILGIKPWMVHCDMKILEMITCFEEGLFVVTELCRDAQDSKAALGDQFIQEALQRRSDSKAVLGDQSIQEYLCKRLNCSEAAFRHMTKKQPAILKVHVTKLQETLDFLFEEGFSSNQVQQIPRVFCHSLATIQERLIELRDLGYNPISLSILCKSLHEYSEFMHKMSGSRKQIAL
uniref:Uncharacterized protein n=1 Tax=Timema cristinae TaxID=61476 RepID=A0A7R9H096_TIMCR|nr:unnamed protein product [Timema cristinae]